MNTIFWVYGLIINKLTIMLYMSKKKQYDVLFGLN